MMATNLFAIANLKQLRTYVVLEFYCLFFRTSWCVGVLNSAIFFNSFHNRVEFGTIFLEGLRNFGGGFQHPKPPLGTPLAQSDTFEAATTSQRLLCTALLKPHSTSHTFTYTTVNVSCLCSDLAVESCTTHQSVSSFIKISFRWYYTLTVLCRRLLVLNMWVYWYANNVLAELCVESWELQL